MVGRPTNAARKKKENLARARQIYTEQRRQAPPEPTHNTEPAESGEVSSESSEGEIECTGWDGGVSHCLSSDDEPIVISDSDSGEEEVEELFGGEVGVMGKRSKSPEDVSHSEAKPSGYSIIMRQQTKKDWKKVESCRSLGYNGQSARTKRHHEQIAREKEKEDAKLRNR